MAPQRGCLLCSHSPSWPSHCRRTLPRTFLVELSDREDAKAHLSVNLRHKSVWILFAMMLAMEGEPCKMYGVFPRNSKEASIPWAPHTVAVLGYRWAHGITSGIVLESQL